MDAQKRGMKLLRVMGDLGNSLFFMSRRVYTDRRPLFLPPLSRLSDKTLHPLSRASSFFVTLAFCIASPQLTANPTRDATDGFLASADADECVSGHQRRSRCGLESAFEHYERLSGDFTFMTYRRHSQVCGFTVT